MESGVALDLFATKGVEYLIVILYLSALTLTWKLFRVTAEARAPHERVDLRRGLANLATQAADVFFHPGHAWAKPTGASSEVVVGWDDFARRLVGPPEKFRLPSEGSRIRAGEPAWTIESEGHVLPMLAPVDGEVVAVNRAVLAEPSLASRDPYGEGWLMRVRVTAPDSVHRNLLSGSLARSWSELAEQALQGVAIQAPESLVGAVMADGGEPRCGLARALAPEGWQEVIERFLLVAPQPEAGPDGTSPF